MQTAQEIASNLKNLRYYSDKIAKSARSQLDLDFARGQEIGISGGPGSIRFECLGVIMSACTWISAYCDSIDVNLQSAIAQDRTLHADEEQDAV